MRIVMALLVLSCVLSGRSYATVKTECRPVRWPYSRNQTQEEYAKLFSRSKRANLTKYYFWELTHSEKKSVEPQLSTYLVNTENDENTKGFLELLDTAAHQKPNGEPGNRVLSMKEICSLYERGHLATPPAKK